MTTTQMELLHGLNLESLSDNLKMAALHLREGKVVLLLDAHEREDEGDLIVAAEKITPESMNFLIKKGSGVVCLALPKERLDFLGLPLMIPDNTNFFQTAFTVSIEAKTGVTTGVSAKDRAHTILTAIADDAISAHLARPGHVFPLAAQKNGVFDRMGHTEGSVDLMRMAGLKPGAVLCELMNEDGSMTIGQRRIDFAHKFEIPVISIEEILFHRIKNEPICDRVSKKLIHTRFGHLCMQSFCFFDGTTIELFTTADFMPSASPTRVALISGDNMANRFLAQMLEQSVDDPLFDALSKLGRHELDLAMMITIDDKNVKIKSEVESKAHAYACRVLRELSITSIELTNTSLARIARDFFSLSVKNN